MDDATRAAIERDCFRLMMTYSRLLDTHQTDKVMELFVEDSVAVFSGNVITGREAIRKVLAGLASRGPVMAHVTTNLWVEPIDDETARGGAYYSVMAAAPSTDGTVPRHSGVLMGRYTDRYRKTPEGWRFERRETENLLRAPEA